VSTIELLFSSTKSFHSQQRLGIIQALEHVLTKNTVSARILMPKADGYSEEDFQRLKKIDGIDIRYFNHNCDIRNKTLVVDRVKSLVIEIKEEERNQINREDKEKILGNSASKTKIKTKSESEESESKEQQQQREKEIISFSKIIGLSTYSNSRSTVLSYAAMFETLWNETELYEQIRQSHSKLEIANEQLERQYKSQRDFVNIAAHEIRTPAQSILGYAEMLDMEHIGSKEYVIPILRNAERLRRLTEDILHLAKTESQTLKLNKEQFNLGKTVLSVTQDIINQSSCYNGKKTNVRMIGGNWERGADEEYEIIVEADRGRIVQVISNILSNAIRFAKEGDVTISIERKGINIDSDDGRSNNNDDDNDNDNNNKREVIVSIRDTGTGIDPDLFPKLFSKSAIASETGGNGLGLFVSKSIIEAHGGNIWAENNSDGKKGATFYFSLPLCR